MAFSFVPSIVIFAIKAMNMYRISNLYRIHSKTDLQESKCF